MITGRKWKCAIFGANGYLGRHMVHVLQTGGHGVHAYDIQEHPFVPDITYTRLDVARSESWQAFDPAVDAVFFFAGLTGTMQGFVQSQRYLGVNEGGLLCLLERIRLSGSHAKVIFPSTRLVYQGSEAPVSEDAPKCPKTVYAINKLACENYLDAYHRAFGIPYTVFRICVPYGNIFSDDYSYGTIGFFLKQAKSGHPIVLFGDGNQRRTFTHVLDICAQVIGVGLMADESDGVYNVGGEEYSLREAACFIASRFGVAVEYKPWPAIDLLLESGSTVFDESRINKVLEKKRHGNLREWLHTI